jgi:hypothetical protein
MNKYFSRVIQGNDDQRKRISNKMQETMSLVGDSERNEQRNNRTARREKNL